MRLVLGAVFALSLAVAGCGSSSTNATCQNFQNGVTAFNMKIAPCQADGGGTSMSINFDVNACDAGIGACNSTDLNSINAYANCLSGLPTCDPSNPQPFFNAFNMCTAPMPTSCSP